MSTPDHRPRRARLVWVVTAVLVVLAVGVPIAVLVTNKSSSHATPSSPASSTSATPDTSETSPSSEPSVVSPPEPVAKGKPRALFFGDSYFIGGGYTDESNSMARLASNRLGWASAINGGGGTGFVQANPDYDLPNFLGQIDQGAFDVGRRSWVVIEGGNDDRFLDQEQVGKNARKVLRIAQRRFPNATVVLVGPLDTDGDYSDTTPVNRTLRKAAKRRGVAYVDARKWLKGHFDLIGPDFTHPYPEGHRICARRLARALRALGA